MRSPLSHLCPVSPVFLSSPHGSHLSWHFDAHILSLGRLLYWFSFPLVLTALFNFYLVSHTPTLYFYAFTPYFFLWSCFSLLISFFLVPCFIFPCLPSLLKKIPLRFFLIVSPSFFVTLGALLPPTFFLCRRVYYPVSPLAFDCRDPYCVPHFWVSWALLVLSNTSSHSVLFHNRFPSPSF